MSTVTVPAASTLPKPWERRAIDPMGCDARCRVDASAPMIRRRTR